MSAFPSIDFLPVFPGFMAKPFRGVGVVFEEPHLRLIVLVSGTRSSPSFSYSAYAAHPGGQVLRYSVGRRLITPKMGNLSVFVLLGRYFLFGIIMK